MSVFILGTDTDAGKTVTAAALMRRYKKIKSLRYWKPIQTGFPEDDDVRTVHELSGNSKEQFLTEGYRFHAPLSPHRAAELENTCIALVDLLKNYQSLAQKHSLLVEGAGGLLAPLNRKHTWLNFLLETELPVVLVGRSGLGTINHSLLTLQVLRHHQIQVLGIVFFGKPVHDNRQTVSEFSGIACLGFFQFEDLNNAKLEMDPRGILQKFLKK